MKLIHTADLHLDSKMNRYFNDNKSKERRNELLLTFQGLVDYAVKEKVEAILIAGDLFDVPRISATARGAVLAAVKGHPDIVFYYLRGNHDADSFIQEVLDREGKLPDNLKLFSKEWTSYEQAGRNGNHVVITGAEADAENNGKLVLSLSLDQNKVNIVTLHGQETETAGKKDAEVIPLREYMNRGIDYLALGHIHAPKLAKLDARGVYAYSGCLEGRGFDECGERGFYLLTVENGKVEPSFVPFAQRNMWELQVDVSSATDSNGAVDCIHNALKTNGIQKKDCVKVILTGEVSLDAEFDEAFIAKALEEDLYFVKVVSDTRPKVDYEGFAKDASLKGEYIRQIRAAVQDGRLSEEDAGEMIRLGIRILSGEEKLA